MERNNLIKKGVAVAVILLFASVSIIPTTGTTIVKKSPMPTPLGNILYVGGNGTGNYSKIQDAIDDANYGDTVFVYDDSSPYYDNIVINKSINLIGENKDTTVIDCLDYYNGNIIYIRETDNININGFTIQNSTYYTFDPKIWGAGIKIKNSNNCNISGNNLIKNGKYGIHIIGRCENISIIGNNITQGKSVGIWHWDEHKNRPLLNCIIKDNIISKNDYDGLWLQNPVDTSIIGNIITDNHRGIHFFFGGHNTNVTRNIISENYFGIDYYSDGASQSTTIQYNNISNNIRGIRLDDSQGNIIKHNNFIGNTIHNIFDTEPLHFLMLRTNQWTNNYYDRSIKLLPKPIFGFITISVDIWHEYTFPWFPLWDLQPAREPYDIGV